MITTYVSTLYFYNELFEFFFKNNFYALVNKADNCVCIKNRLNNMYAVVPSNLPKYVRYALEKNYSNFTNILFFLKT